MLKRTVLYSALIPRARIINQCRFAPRRSACDYWDDFEIDDGAVISPINRFYVATTVVGRRRMGMFQTFPTCVPQTASRTITG